MPCIVSLVKCYPKAMDLELLRLSTNQMKENITTIDRGDAPRFGSALTDQIIGYYITGLNVPADKIEEHAAWEASRLELKVKIDELMKEILEREPHPKAELEPVYPGWWGTSWWITMASAPWAVGLEEAYEEGLEYLSGGSAP